ncbi:KICSTOR complex protein SZT2 [Collichthys lucidus]|uniref:KICSTOR complex protein SZT2 n=1 Tax=Collichthys lucidus TaxID=240159 RepID=A0A4U5UHG6_COLLU|nr:KICSTOR complex protein SZT2 [Collichthys lucidus]
MAERQDNEVEEADQIYLLMKEEYRISRNVRLAWFLGKLNQVIWPASKPELLNSENELDLLSILPKGWQSDFSPTMYPYMLMPSTRATFLARRYRFIIELDLSPSTGIVDDSTGEMIFDEVFHALSRCLAGLAQPFQVPGTDQFFKPKIFITILAYSSIIGLTSHQVLVQGCQLDRTDLDEFLHHIYQQLRAVESNIAQVLHQQHEQAMDPVQSSGLHSNILDDQPHRKQGISMVSADMGLVSMVRQGILALQLLPPNSSAGIIIITDGVTSVPDVAVCETLLNQLRSGTIACSFVQVGGAYSYDCSFGYIPNVELMKFISLATFGSYLPSCPEVDLNSQEMNAYHKAFLTYSFLKTPESMNSEYFCVSQHKLFNEHLVSASGNPALVMRRKKHTEKEVHAHLISVVSVRLREGYTIREISLTKGGTQLEVKLVLLWKHNMHIEYLAAASWPLDPAKRTTRVEVTMEGSYDILHDISCTQRKPITSPYRTSVIRRFWNTLQSINQTDQMLVHLQSFNSIPENYMIPESTKNGVPLFYIPPGSTTPVLSLQHSGSKDSSQSQFACYWKPILSMDANFWQRWLHMHRIAIILEHDMPVPKHLHTAGNNGRYSTIQCRISHSALTSLLRDWSSFVLVEGYSYVKLIYSSSDQPPTSFYLVRLISKTPCMVLRLGFPIGTPAHVRNKIVDELREQILKLRFPHRVQNKEATPKTKRKNVSHPSPSKSPSIPAPKPALSDRPCVVVLNKPLEKLLIRYEKLPLDFRTPFIFNMENFPQPSNSTVPLSMAANRTASSTLASLSRYFLHQRWVWAVQSSQGSTVAMQAVAHILSMLSEIRLSEGFHFAASGEGIVNMVIELPMKGMSGDTDRESHSCIVQYILFPPHSTSTKDSFSTDDDNDTEVEAVDLDTELNLVTECWVEPQSGTVMNCMDQHRHFQGLKYQEVPQAIFPRDLACMSTMMTFEFLSQLCQNKDQVCSLPAGLKDMRGEAPACEDSIHMVPFQFDLIQLLPKCQQVELFFLTFSTAVENDEQVHSSTCLPNELLLSLFHNSLEHELSDREIPLADGDHVAFIHHILERERDGHVAPFSLPVIKEECVRPADRQDMTSFHTTCSSKEVMGSTSTLQSFSNADLVDEEPLLGERNCSTPQWRCYAKYINSQQILLTFLPASFTDVLMLMASGLEPQSNVSTQEDDTLTPSNKSHADSLSGSTSGMERSESGLSLASKMRRSSSSGHFTAKSPVLSPRSESQTGPVDSLNLDQDSLDSRMSETETGTPGSDLGEKEGVQFSEPQKADFHISFSRQVSQQSASDSSQLKCPVYVYNCSLDHLKEQLVHPNSSHQPRDIFFSEEDIWKNESLYRQRLNNSDDYNTEESYQARDYLAATMQFIPGHFACDVVWSTIIHIHPRLKMGPNIGVSRAIQALRSVLNSFCVVNRKNMFVYQERTTKSVFYLRLCEMSLTGKYSDVDGNLHSRSIALARSQEPLISDDIMGSRSSLDSSRPVGQVDKHILLLVHGVGNAGPEITDELVKVLRKRLDETTLDIITVMLVRNCKLTPADVEFIQPSGSPATEVMNFSLPQYCLPCLSAVAHYLRQNLLIFLHVPKYTDSNTAHHFKHYFHLSSDLADGDIYLYNKPGGQGTGGKGTMSELVQQLFPPSQFKGIACITLSFVDTHGRPLQVPAQDCAGLQRSENCTIPLHPDNFDELTTVGKVYSINVSSGSEPQLYVRFDIWEQGNVSPLQLSDKLQGALRHALCDVVMELRVLPNPLCVGGPCPATKAQREEAKELLNPLPEVREVKDSHRQRSGSRVFKSSPSPITLTQATGNTSMTGTSTPESTTPTSKSTRRSFWDILSKPDSSELGSPKTTDDIVQEKGEEGRAARRRHKTENVKQQWSQEKAMAVELEQAQRRQVSQLEEGDVGTLHHIYQVTFQPWITFMAKLGCSSIQQCTAEIASHFLLPSILAEIVNLVSSLASDTTVKAFERRSCPTSGDIFVPFPLVQNLIQPPGTTRSFILVARNFHQWHCSTEQAHKGFQRFEALEQSDWFSPSQAGAGLAPRQRFLFISILDKKVTLYSYNWSVDLGASLNRELVRLVKWQNARAHVVHCLLNQKMGLFHHYCFSDAPIHEMDSKQDPNPFLSPSMEPDALLRSAVPPLPSKEQGRLSSSGRSLAPLHFPSELLPFDEALRDVCTIRPLMEGDAVARHGGQLLDIKAAERREMEKQMKIENLFVTWQQRSAQSNMPISGTDLETLKHSSRLVHYCATPLLFDPVFRKQIQEEQIIQSPVKKRHRSSDSTASGRDRSYSTDSADMLPSRLKEEPWLLEISSTFLQQYVQYLQSMGFILVQVRPQSPARSIARARAAMLSSMSSEGRMSFSYVKQKSEDSPKGCYFCVKQYALECSRIPMGQTVNSQSHLMSSLHQGSLLTKPRCKPFPDATPVSDCALSMLFTEECDKVRDLMHVHSFSYDFHLRVVHQYLVGCHMTLRQGYQLTDFLDDFISHHPDIPKFGRNHVFQGSFSISTGMITAHQLYNYITDHASTYGMKPLRMSKATVTSDSKKGAPDLHEYALVALWNSSGSYKDLEGLHHHDDFDVSLVVCHNAAPFEEQSDGERHLLRLRFYVIMTSQRELFPRLTADMRRFKKLPQIHRDPGELGGRLPPDRAEACGSRGAEQDLWEETSSEAAAALAPSDGNEFYPLAVGGPEAQGLLYPSPLFPLLNNEVASARRQIQASVEQAMGHCRRDNLWRRLFHGEHLALDKLKLTKLSFSELEELLDAVQSRSVGEIDPQLDCFLTMSPAWYQSLIKVLLNRFPQSCRHFDDNGIQYLAVLNQKFTDCFVLVFLDTQAGKTSLKVVFREPLPSQTQASSSPPPQLVSMYHHLESVINTACYNLWTGLL